VRRGVYSAFGKRLFDLTVSALGLLILSPVLLFLGVAVFLSIGWPPLFTQERVGWQGRVFKLRKFRTMRTLVDADGHPLPDSERLTPLGRLMRATSLDELPELYNVAVGDMSLVGPRPLLPRYVPFYTDTEARRHDVRPGITGLAQIRGRNLASWDARLALDVQYVEQASFPVDVSILLGTVGVVFGRHGAVPDPTAVMRDLDVERGGGGIQ